MEKNRIPVVERWADIVDLTVIVAGLVALCMFFIWSIVEYTHGQTAIDHDRVCVVEEGVSL